MEIAVLVASLLVLVRAPAIFIAGDFSIANQKKGARYCHCPPGPRGAQSRLSRDTSRGSVSNDEPKSPQHEETEQDRKRHRNFDAMGV
jgi:hypothetical protein